MLQEKAVDDLGAAERFDFSAGDTEAFRRFFEEYAPQVIALCRRILGRLEDAEDVAAEVFFEVWTRRTEYDRRRSSLRTYLIMLARSRAIDRIRAQARSTPREPAHPTETVWETPVNLAESDELRSAAIEAIDNLDGGQRDALMLAFFEGLSHQRISDRLQTPLGTVKSNIRKGLQRLRFALKEYRSEAAP